MTSGTNRRWLIGITVPLVILAVLGVFMLAASVGLWAWVVVMTTYLALGALAIGLLIRGHRRARAADVAARAKIAQDRRTKPTGR
jgi:protein-S-isoprenylcysteine O-methyltransferase Ste14